MKILDKVDSLLSGFACEVMRIVRHHKVDPRKFIISCAYVSSCMPMLLVMNLGVYSPGSILSKVVIIAYIVTASLISIISVAKIKNMIKDKDADGIAGREFALRIYSHEHGYTGWFRDTRLRHFLVWTTVNITVFLIIGSKLPLIFLLVPPFATPMYMLLHYKPITKDEAHHV